MAFTRISNASLNSRGATILPDQPTIAAPALKEEFDAPAKKIVAPAVNNLMDELEATTSAGNLGAVAPTGRTGATVQAVINSVSGDLATLEASAGQAIADAHTHANKALLDTYTQTEADLAQAVADEHTHSNKALLDTYSQTETDLADAVTKKHEHSNKALLDSYTQTEADIADAVSEKHTHSNKTLLDSYAQSETDLADAVSKKHAHSNKALLDTYSQSESDLADAVLKKHEHSNKSVIDDLSDDGSGHLLYDGNPIGGGSVNDAYKSVKVTSGVDDTTISASGEDTFELHAGSNVTLTVDTTSTPKKITVNSTGGGGGTTYQAGDGIDISGNTIALDYGMLTGSNLTKPVVGKDIADALDGKADTSDIPANLSDLADDTTHRLVTDAEKTAWDAKVSESLLKDTVGWVGKNKLNITLAQLKTLNTTGTWNDNAYTINGVTLTCTTDSNGYVTNIAGSNTPTSNATMFMCDNMTYTDEFILSGCASGGGASTYKLLLVNSSGTSLSLPEDYGNGAKIQTNNSFRVQLRVYKGQSADGLNFKPMLRDASITDSTFEPFHESVEQTLRDAEVIEGPNILDILKYATWTSKTVIGITLNNNYDGTFGLSGTSTDANVNVWLMGGYNSGQTLFTLPAGEYTIQDCNLYKPSGGSSGAITTSIGERKTFVLSEPMAVGGVRCANSVNGQTYNTTLKPLLAYGVYTGDFKPYYIPLKDSKFDRAEQRVLGAWNLCDYKKFTANGTTITFGDESIRVQLATSATWKGISQTAIPCKTNTNYVVSLDSAITSGMTRIKVSGTPTSGGTYAEIRNSGDKTASGHIEVSFNTGNNKYLWIEVFTTNNTITTCDVTLSNIMLSTNGGKYAPYAMTNRELTELTTVQESACTDIISGASVESTINHLYKQGNVVCCSVYLQSVTADAWNTVFVIPEGFRPKTKLMGLSWSNVSKGFVGCEINVNGAVQFDTSCNNNKVRVHLTWITD